MSRVFFLSIAAAVWVATHPAGSRAQDVSPTDGALGGSVWYDADSEETIPVEVHDETRDSVNRDSRWLPKPKRVPKPNQPSSTVTTGAGGTGGAGMFGTGLTLGYLFGWAIAIAVVAALIAAFVYAVSSASFDSGEGATRKNRNGNEPSVDEQTLARVKHLPAELRRTDVNMRDEAERLMKLGKFDQAIILLFGHQLLMLDRAGYLRLNRSKTNGRYVRETRASDRVCSERLRKTVEGFERSYFGRHDLSAEEFQDLWRRNEAMESDLAANEGVAA